MRALAVAIWSGTGRALCLWLGLLRGGIGLLCLWSMAGGPGVQPARAANLLVLLAQASTPSHYMTMQPVLAELASGGRHRVTLLMSESNAAVPPDGWPRGRQGDQGEVDGFEFVLYSDAWETELIQLRHRRFKERVTAKADRARHLSQNLMEASLGGDGDLSSSSPSSSSTTSSSSFPSSSFTSSSPSSRSSCSPSSCSSSTSPCSSSSCSSSSPSSFSSSNTSPSSSSSSTSPSPFSSSTPTLSTIASNPWHSSAVECDSLLANATLLAALRQSGYDLLIGDPAASLCPPLLAASLAVPFVQYSVQGFRALRHDRWFGADFHPAFMPVPLLPFCEAMGPAERLANYVARAVSVLLIQRNNYAAFERLQERHGIGAGASLDGLLRQSRLHLVNANTHVLDFVQPVLPNMIQVGGVNTRPAKPLDQDLMEFFEGSGPHGVVVISMGTSLGFNEESMRDITGALSRLRQRVVWIQRDPPVTSVGNNTRMVAWVSMNDVLGHPKTRVLVNHGGTSTVLEAVYHGVPMVLVPLSNDMFDVTYRAVCRGVALELSMSTITGTTLVEAVQKVISDPSYRERASHYSGVMKSTKPTPLQTAVFWIEHVLRHGADVDYLRPASARDGVDPWRSTLLDVLAVWLLVCAVSATILACLCRKLAAAVRTLVS